jgi:hypothetical protein
VVGAACDDDPAAPDLPLGGRVREGFGWREATEEIIARLNVEEVYREDFGADFAGSCNGEWQSIRRLGETDNKPSASFHVGSGAYHDFCTGQTVSLFDAAVLAGRFGDWREARNHYAERTGVELPGRGRSRGPGGPPRAPAAPRPAKEYADRTDRQREFEEGREFIERVNKCDVIGKLAAQLGTPKRALDRLRVGVDFFDDGKFRGWTFPERTPGGRIIGHNIRLAEPMADGTTKRQDQGGSRGLTLADGAAPRPGQPWLVVEGASDVASGLTMGLDGTVGRPSVSGGSDLCAELLRAQDGDVLVVVENDEKPDGSWPGRDGSARFARKLRDALGDRVKLAFMPDGYKDVRDYLNKRSQAALGGAPGHTAKPVQLDKLGDDFLAALRIEEVDTGSSIIIDSLDESVNGSSDLSNESIMGAAAAVDFSDVDAFLNSLPPKQPSPPVPPAPPCYRHDLSNSSRTEIAEALTRWLGEDVHPAHGLVDAVLYIYGKDCRRGEPRFARVGMPCCNRTRPGLYRKIGDVTQWRTKQLTCRMTTCPGCLERRIQGYIEALVAVLKQEKAAALAAGKTYTMAAWTGPTSDWLCVTQSIRAAGGDYFFVIREGDRITCVSNVSFPLGRTLPLPGIVLEAVLALRDCRRQAPPPAPGRKQARNTIAGSNRKG